MKKLKKSISLSLASILLTSSFSQLNASIASDLLGNNVMNATEAGSVTIKDSDGSTVSKTFYSPGLYIRFSTKPPPPIFSASPPTIQAGCNGLNLKQMTISLMGLDQLGSMLTTAGGTGTWGIVVGLIYSLPGIANAFKMINQWAKDIQNLLGNACQSGIVLGQAIAKKAGIDKNAMENKIMSTLQSTGIAKCSQERENCLASALGLGDYFTKDGILDLGGSNPPMTDKDKKDALSSMFRGLFESDISLGAKIIYSLFVNGDYNDALDDKVVQVFGFQKDSNDVFQYKKFTIGDAPDTGNIKSLPIDTLVSTLSTSQEDQRRLSLFAYLLTYNFVGDIVITDTNKFLESALNNYISSGTSDAKEKAAQMLENLKSIQPTVHISGPGAALPPSAAGKKLADFLVNGSEALAETDAALEAPVMIAIRAEDEKSTSRAFTILSSDITQGSGKIDMSGFKGIEHSSRCIINDRVGNVLVVNDCPTSEDEKANMFPAVIPDLEEFVKIILNSPMEKRAALTDMLIKYNTYLVTSYIIDSMNATLNIARGFGSSFIKQDSPTEAKTTANAKGEKPGFAENSANTEMEYIKKLDEVLSKAKEILEKQKVGDVTTFQLVQDTFRKQKIENRERGMKSLSN